MMNVLTPVSSIMTKNLKTVNASDSLVKVRELFKMHSIHHIPVVSYKQIIGMISKEDYLNFQHGCVGEKASKHKREPP